MLKRSDISGFEFKVFGFTVEVVTIYRRFKGIYLWKKNRFIKSWEV